MRKRIQMVMTYFETGTRLTYILFRGNPTEVSKVIEAVLFKEGLQYNRLIDPDCYSLRDYVTSHFGGKILLIEARGDVGKVFYMVPGRSMLGFENLRPEFRLKFMITKRAGLEALADYICRGKITKRHAHRSSLNFLVSMITGFLSSLLGESFGFFVQLTVGLLVIFAVLFFLEYPLSLLSLKGVRVVEEKVKVKVFVVRTKEDGANRSEGSGVRYKSK